MVSGKDLGRTAHDLPLKVGKGLFSCLAMAMHGLCGAIRPHPGWWKIHQWFDDFAEVNKIHYLDVHPR